MSVLHRLLAAATAAILAPSAARAGETACWFEAGLIIVPAQVMGVAGDFILDTATPDTELHEDVAQAAGFADTALTGEVRLAGLRLQRRPVKVLSLDSRGWMLPTPLVGVIGADILKSYVVDVSFAPCRVRLSRPGRAPRLKRAASLPIAWIGGRPTVRAGVSDGPHAWTGPFAIATGADAPIRLSEAAATVPGAKKPQELYLNGVLHPKLRALSIAGSLREDLPSGLEKDQGAAGLIGAEALAPRRLRFDFPAGMLTVGP